MDKCISSDGFSSVYLVTEKGTNKQFAANSFKPISNPEDNQKLTLTILHRRFSAFMDILQWILQEMMPLQS